MKFLDVFGVVVWLLAAATVVLFWRLLRVLDKMNTASAGFQRELAATVEAGVVLCDRLDAHAGMPTRIVCADGLIPVVRK